MPCSSGDIVDHYTSRVENLKSQLEFSDACLCALFTQLERQGIIDSVVEQASKNGSIDISTKYKEHRSKDEVRLKNKLQTEFSKDELRLIKEFLDKEEL